jgi:hypothetical protein
MKKRLAGPSLALAVLLLAVTASPAFAIARVWGATGAGAQNWTVPGNWVGNAAPQAGDDLSFPAPAGTLSLKTNNDFPAGTSFRTLTLNGGYSITGNGFNLDGVNPATALTVAPGQKPVITTGAIFMHNINANATSTISLGAASLLDMRATPQVTVGDLANAVTNLVVTGGANSQFYGPSTLGIDTFHLMGSATYVPQLLTQNANTPGTMVTDPGTLISTTPNAGGTLASASSMTINGDLREAVSAASTGGLDFIGPVTFGSSSTVTWEVFNSNQDNVINFTRAVNLSPATFSIALPPGFQPVAPNAVYPVITSQGPAFTPATEFANMKDGDTQTVGGFTFKGQYNVPTPGDFRVLVSGPPTGAPGLPGPPSTGHKASSPSGPAIPVGVVFGLAGLLLAIGGATFHYRRR